MLFMFLYLAVFVLWIVIEFTTAPRGYEDPEKGFCYGISPEEKIYMEQLEKRKN